MSPTEEQIIGQIKKLLNFEFSMDKTKTDDFIAWANNVLSVFKLTLAKDDTRIQSLETAFRNYLESGKTQYGFDKNDLYNTFNGFLKGFDSDYREGFLTDLRLEIRSEVEHDFLSQAKHLLDEGLKDSPAMIIGAVLEDTLRQLCKKHKVEEGSNIESMNVPLRKAGAYRLPIQQQVTAWGAIRNSSDHARFDQYDISQVKLMHQGVTDFIAKHLC